MRIAALLTMLVLLAQGAQARGSREAGVPELCELASIVVVGEVESIERSGITTSLSYPTTEGIEFYWLRVRIRIAKGGLLKGSQEGPDIDVAMLSDKDETGMQFRSFNSPSMLSPEVGSKYILFLAPSEHAGMYVSLFAPWDEENTIFILNRASHRYDMSSIGKNAHEYRKQQQEIRDMVFMLTDEADSIDIDGIKRFAELYKQQLAKPTEQKPIALEWKKLTNKGGWSTDVPKSYTPASESEK